MLYYFGIRQNVKTVRLSFFFFGSGNGLALNSQQAITWTLLCWTGKRLTFCQHFHMDFYVWESFNFCNISLIFMLRGYNWQFSIGSGNGLVPSDNKPIIWSRVDPFWWRCMALLGCNELKLINGFFIPSALNIDNSCLQARRYDILHMLCREGSYTDVSTVTIVMA